MSTAVQRAWTNSQGASGGQEDPWHVVGPAPATFGASGARVGVEGKSLRGPGHGAQ